MVGLHLPLSLVAHKQSQPLKPEWRQGGLLNLQEISNSRHKPLRAS